MVQTGGTCTGLVVSKWANVQQQTEGKTRVRSYALPGGPKSHFGDLMSSDGEWDSDYSTPTAATSINTPKLTDLQQGNRKTVCGAFGENECDFMDKMPSGGQEAEKMGSPTFNSAATRIAANCWEMSQSSYGSGKHVFPLWSDTVKVGLQRNDCVERDAAAGWMMGHIDDQSSFLPEGCKSAIVAQVSTFSKKLRRVISFEEAKEAQTISNVSKNSNGSSQQPNLKPWGAFPCRNAEPHYLVSGHDAEGINNDMKFHVKTAAALEHSSEESAAGQSLALDAHSLPDNEIYVNASCPSSSPAYQTPIKRPNSFANVEKINGDCVSPDAHRTTLSGFDWRRKRSASMSNFSSIRALDATFIARQLNLQDQTGLLGMPFAEKVVLESCCLSKGQGRLSGASSTPLWPNSVDQCSVSLNKNSTRQKASSVCALQIDPNVQYEPGIKSARSSPSAKRRLSLSSEISVHHLPGRLENRSTLNSTHRKHKSELGIACNPYVLDPKPIQPLPGPRGTLTSWKYSSPAVKHGSSLLKYSGIPKVTNLLPTLCGNLRRVYQDGFPCYTFLLDKSDKMLTAKGHKVNCTEKDGYIWMYTFYSGNLKSKGGWMTLGRKEKADAEFVGKMKVSSILHMELMSEGETNVFLESEFVLYSGSPQMQSSKPPYMDVPKQQPASLSHVKKAFNAARSNAIPSPSVQVPHVIRPVDHVCEKVMETKLDSSGFQSLMGSPLKIKLRRRPSSSQDVCNDLDLPDVEPELLRAWPSHLELAAIVINVPLGASESHASIWDKINKEKGGGWGLKFLYKSLERNKNSQARNAGRMVSVASIEGHSRLMESDHSAKSKLFSSNADLVEGSMYEDGFSGCLRTYSQNRNQHGKKGHTITEENTISERLVGIPSSGIHSGLFRATGPSKDLQSKDRPNITVVLPAGEHGLPSLGSGGPSSLIERWKSGGMCDCGGWDLGCELTVMSTERPSLYSSKSSPEIIRRNSTGLLAVTDSLTIFSQGNKQEMAVFSLEVIQDGFFSLNFRAQFSDLQAFAMAVSILHSNETLASTGMEEKVFEQSKERLLIVNTSGSKSKGNFAPSSDLSEEFGARHSPEVSLSPFERV